MGVRTQVPILPPRHRSAPSKRSEGPGGRWGDRRGVQPVAALGLYLLASVLLFGIPVLGDMRHAYVGLGQPDLGTGFTDPSVYMWSMVWWPHAIVHGMNPLVTHVVWAPQGVGLAWTTTIPGASILAWPVTAMFGPVAAFNAWMLLAPALAAWTAYLLFRHVTGAFWPSLVGGYLFGFSSYELAQMTAHLNLALIFPIPLAALLVLLRVEGSLRPVPFVLLMAGTVALQFAFSQELAFTMTVFGILVGLLALVLFPKARRPLVIAAGWTAVSYLVAAVVLIPFLPALPGASAFVPRTWPSKYATDLLNFVVPTRIALVASHAARGVASRFAPGLSEEGAYLGPVLLLVALFAARAGRTRTGGFVLASLGLILLASLGPGLRVGGVQRAGPLPWAAAGHVPLLRMALPARFMVYAWLVLGLLAALWLAAPIRGAWARWGKWGVAGLCVVALLPNLALPLWHSRSDTPPFFATALYRRYLEPGRNTLVIPFASNGFSMLWQAETDLAFPMAGGYIACAIPPEYRRWAIVATFLSKRRLPGFENQLRAFLGHLDVANVVVDPRARGPWSTVFGALAIRPVGVGGILYYRIPDRLLAQYRTLHPPNVTRKALRQGCQ
jgi:hypothetical protein